MLTNSEIEKQWNNYNGQGNKKARYNHNLCVLVECDRKRAYYLTRKFIKEFNIPSCCYYDGYHLSMYCGDAGGNYINLRQRIEKIVEESK